MKFQALLWLASLAAPHLANGQYFLAEQFFDGADTIPENTIAVDIDSTPGNVWQIGRPQKPLFDSAATLPNAIVTDTALPYPTNNTSRFSIHFNSNQFPTIGIFALQWNQKLDLTNLNDGGMVEFSKDSGNTWENAFTSPYVYNFYGFNQANQQTLGSTGVPGFSGTDSSWKNIWLCFDYGYVSNFNTLMVRYSLITDSIPDGKDGWVIDNLYAYQTMVHTVSEAPTETYMTVKPNPTSGRIYIETKKLQEYHIIESIELINADGHLVQHWGLSPTKFFVDVDHHPNGLYFLKVKTNYRTETFKILINR